MKVRNFYGSISVEFCTGMVLRPILRVLLRSVIPDCFAGAEDSLQRQALIHRPESLSIMI
ncbi:MAG: hypothetical protein EAX81_06785 [Candidatus Thorarchaeota archaeon]|nr:hypothetical protein [Candidatus Thorarchaeota archaeon]